jgi:hypothetical protein
VKRAAFVTFALALTGYVEAHQLQQSTGGDCSPALAYVSGNVEIRCELDSRALKQLASTVMQFQKESKARSFQTEQLVRQINLMLASVSTAQAALRGRVEHQALDIAGISQLITERLTTSGKPEIALAQTRAWPGEFESLRAEWRELDNGNRFVAAYESVAAGQLSRAIALLAQDLTAKATNDASAAVAHYLLGRLDDLQFRPSAAFSHYQTARRLDSSHVEYQLRYANALQQRNASAESAQQYEASLKMLRSMAVSQPDRYRPLLAWTLKNLAEVRVSLTQQDEAEAAYGEARDIYRDLVKTNPEAFAPDFVASLGQLGLLYGDARRYREAEAALLMADETYRHLAAQDRWQYEPALVINLLRLAGFHRQLDRGHEADADLSEAERRAKALAAEDAIAFGPLLAEALNERGLWWGDDSRHALEAYRSALSAAGPAMKANPSVYEADFAEILQMLARAEWNTSWEDRGGPRVMEALAHLDQARDIYARLARTDAAKFEPKLVRALRDVGHMNMLSGRYKEADEALRAAKQIAVANSELRQRQLPGIDSDLEDVRSLWDHARAQK